ncbi:MAG: hypothetical protein KDA61_22555, partial [Planctomycetales bacterium]|nr:hypothetical protein [Planctomycetales bacterium]
MKTIAALGAVASAILALSPPCAAAAEQPFAGWGAYHVVEQDGRPYLLRTADLNQDGSEELIIVNSRFSRLDIYGWKADAKESANGVDDEHPNLLPLPPQ